MAGTTRKSSTSDKNSGRRQRSTPTLVRVRSDDTDRTDGGASDRATDIASPTELLNRQIVEMLQGDGRMPFAEIAGALGVSEGTIRNRVNGMRQSGQLRIVAIADPRAIEYRTDAMLGLKVARGTTPSAVAERLRARPEIVYILWVSGRFDLLVEVVCDAHDALLTFLDTHIHNQDDVSEVETMTGLKNFKNQFLLKQNWE